MGAGFRLTALLGALILVLLPVIAIAPARAATDRLPDLRMEPLRDARITFSGGRRLLRFTAIMSNRGVGPFETRATRPAVGQPWTVRQRIFDDAGGHRDVTTGAGLVYAVDGHDHWHVRDMMSYDLWGPGGTFRGAKVGFCFFDTTYLYGSNPAHYQEASCGHQGSLATVNGITVGWGDNYPWNFAFQWVDITHVSGGTYWLRATVDQKGHFTESAENDNCAWLRLTIPASGTNLGVQGGGLTCIDDIWGSPFEPDIRWLYDQGITTGCSVQLFCTFSPVSREELAAFLSRALDLPPTATDYFTDDESSYAEADINRVAAAGITTGCTATTYCPRQLVTRGQMAAFVHRALT